MTPTEIHLLFQLLALLAPPPNATATGQQAAVPAEVHRRLADTAEGILRCYHPTGRLQTVDIVGSPWSRQQDWNGTASALLKLHWRGTIYSYTSVVALVKSEDKVHGVLLSDPARIPASKQCALDGVGEGEQLSFAPSWRSAFEDALTTDQRVRSKAALRYVGRSDANVGRVQAGEQRWSRAGE